MNITCSAIAKTVGLQFDRKVGQQIIFHCPNHDDLHGSLTIHPDKNVWMCGPCGKHGGAWDFAFFISNKNKVSDVITWLVERGLMEERARTKGNFVNSHVYRDPKGNPFLLVKKFIDDNNKKSYALYRNIADWEHNPDWQPGIGDIKLYPYRINEWIDRPVVYIVEGEKDADAMWKLGLPATTNPMGANSWKEDYNQWFKGKNVVIIPDNDQAGQQHAKTILYGIAALANLVKVVELPGLPEKGDFSDWLAAGGNLNTLREIVLSTKIAAVTSKHENSSHVDAYVAELQERVALAEKAIYAVSIHDIVNYSYDYINKYPKE
jgi:DNA primase